MTDPMAVPVQLDPAFYERLFHGAGLSIFACDPAGRIIGWNRDSEKLWRKRVNVDITNANVRDIFPPSDREAWDHSLSQLRHTLEPVEFRVRFSVDRARTLEFAVWLTPGINVEGRLESFAVWFHDITSHLQIRSNLRKRERLTALGVLSGSVAHHYNNLLCSIATSLEFALNMNTMSAMRRVLRRTSEAVRRASQLTQQLLAFAQADHRATDLADLTETVLQFFDEYQPHFTKHKIHLDINWEQVPFRAVPREHMIVVLRNITANAVDVMADGGKLTVSLQRRDESSVLISITDSGPGIPADVMERVFEPFFTTKAAPGEGNSLQAGMGLAVAHGLIAEMDGSITASNAPSGGARFEIVLPIHARSTTDDHREIEPPSACEPDAPDPGQ